jgi:hypothetical protein
LGCIVHDWLLPSGYAGSAGRRYLDEVIMSFTGLIPPFLVGLGVWFSVYLSNRVWLTFKGILS